MGVVSLRFFQGLTEDYSLRVNHSAALNKLLWRDRGGTSIYMDFFLAGRYMQSSIHLGKKKLLLITKNRYLKLMILVLFCVWLDARIRGH